MKELKVKKLQLGIVLDILEASSYFDIRFRLDYNGDSEWLLQRQKLDQLDDSDLYSIYIIWITCKKP